MSFYIKRAMKVSTVSPISGNKSRFLCSGSGQDFLFEVQFTDL